MRKNWKPFGCGLLIVLLTVLAYIPALRGGFIWDDDAHVTQNPGIVSPDGFKAIWTTTAAVYYPLSLTSFWLQHALWGFNPWPYHLVNILVHALAAVVLWRVLLKLNMPDGWLGAMLWALHPVQVESVAWMTELKNTQSGLFFLLAVLFFQKWLDASAEPGVDGKKFRSRRNYALVLLFAVLAVLTKTSTVMLPVVLVLCAWWKERRVTRRAAVACVPLFLISAAAGGWTVWEQRFHSGALGAAWSQTLPERFAVAGKAVWFYLGKLLWPHPLMFVYPRWTVHSSQAVLFLLVVATTVALFVLARRRPAARAGFFAFACFLVLLFPVMGFFNMYFSLFSFTQDHLQYLASMGPLALAGAGIARVAAEVTRRKCESRQGIRLVTSAATIGKSCLLLALASLSWSHAKTFETSETLWRDTLQKNPNCWMAENNLGLLLDERGDFAEAKAHYQRALDLKPDYPEALANLGGMLVEEGQVGDGMEKIRRALELNPRLDSAQKNYAVALLAAGRAEEAVTFSRALLEREPDDARALNNFAAALLTLGRFDEAVPPLQKLLQREPNQPRALSNLGLAFAGKKQWDDALACYEKSLRLDPRNVTAQYNLACALANLGRRDEAVVHLLEALRLQPDSAQVKEMLLALTANAKP